MMEGGVLSNNVLYYGDNLDIVRRYIKDESVDLVYLDPPFKSGQDYNVLFAEKNGSKSHAQIQAFEDTWTWDMRAAEAYQDIVEKGPASVSKVMLAFRTFVGENDMLAYLCMMAPRLVELRRVLKSTGSMYLHCDPTASHYLKLLMDAVFDARNFRNEIIWQRTQAKSLMTRRLPQNHDVILAYQKGDLATWNEEAVYVPYDLEDLDEKTTTVYKHRDQDGRLYQLDNLVNPNPNRPNLTYEFLGIKRVWRWTKKRMMGAYRYVLIVKTKPGTVPLLKLYLDEQRGRPFGDVWTDIPPIASQAHERLGYPTQKPEALLHRIISASSNRGDVVLDPFCGCGTAIAVAERLERRWVGIDITRLAIALIKHRLRHAFGKHVSYKVVGEPVGISEAEALAKEDPYQFQWWALGLVGARPVEQKKGSDKGIDGRLYFHDEASSKGKTKQILLQIKAGNVSVAHVRDLRGVIERENAEIGALICLEEPTQAMRSEAASAGFYKSPWGRYPRLQICTVKEIMLGKGIEYPSPRDTNVTFKRAPRAKRKGNGTATFC